MSDFLAGSHNQYENNNCYRYYPDNFTHTILLIFSLLNPKKPSNIQH